MQKEYFTPDKYTSRTISMSFLKANIVGTLFPVPLAVIFVVLFGWTETCRKTPGVSMKVDLHFFLWLLLFYVACFLLITLHELTHALFFLSGCENRWKSIRFGIKAATPFCHCKEVLSLSVYRYSLMAPLWVICAPLAAAALITGSLFAFFAAVIMIFGSGGDLAILWSLRKYKGKHSFVWDMEDTVGCIVYEPIQSKDI